MHTCISRTGTKIINVGMIRHASCKDTREECQTHRLTEIGATFNGTVTVNFCEALKT